MSGDANLEGLAARAEALLRERLGTRVTNLRVQARDGGVALYGTVYSFYSKQVAQQVAMQELGLRVVANEIEVRWDRDTRADQGPETG